MIIQDFLLKRKWIILTFSLGVIFLATSGYIIYREVYRPKSPNAVLSKYRYLFRPQADIDELNKLIRSQQRMPVTEKYPPSPDTCKLSCSNETFVQQDNNNASNNDNTTDNYRPSNNTIEKDKHTVRNRRQSQFARLRDDSADGYVNHGCCRSKQEYITAYKLAHYQTGTKLHIVKFRNEWQHFLTDRCTHDTGCDRGCKCGQQMITAVAVVVDIHRIRLLKEKEYNEYVEENARIELVKYPGWCKCFND